MQQSVTFTFEFNVSLVQRCHQSVSYLKAQSFHYQLLGPFKLFQCASLTWIKVWRKPWKLETILTYSINRFTPEQCENVAVIIRVGIRSNGNRWHKQVLMFRNHTIHLLLQCLSFAALQETVNLNLEYFQRPLLSQSMNFHWSYVFLLLVTDHWHSFNYIIVVRPLLQQRYDSIWQK